MSTEKHTENGPGAIQEETQNNASQLTAEEADLLGDSDAFVVYFETQTEQQVSALESEYEALTQYPGTAVLRDTAQMVQEQADAVHDLSIADSVTTEQLEVADHELSRRNKDSAHITTHVPGVHEAMVATDRLLDAIMWHREHLTSLYRAFTEASFSNMSTEVDSALTKLETLYQEAEQRLGRMEEAVRNTAGIHDQIQS